jgi:hypothetical protein
LKLTRDHRGEEGEPLPYTGRDPKQGGELDGKVLELLVKHVPVRVLFCTIYKCRRDASDVEGLPKEIIIRVVLDQDAILVVDAVI